MMNTKKNQSQKEEVREKDLNKIKKSSIFGTLLCYKLSAFNIYLY